MTRFQAVCLQALGAVTDVANASVEGDTEKYITGGFQKPGLRYYIYADGAEIWGPTTSMQFERWDFATCQKLVEAFVDEARKIEI